MAETKMYYTKSPGWTWSLQKSPALGVPSGVSSVKDGKYKVKKIVLTLTRVKNSNYPIYYVNGTFIANRGQVKSSNPINISLTVEGVTSSTVTVSSGPVEFKGTGVVNGITCYTDVSSYVPANQEYTFTFNNPPILKRTSKMVVNMGNGYTAGNTSGISLGSNGWKNCYWILEDAQEPPKPPDPPPYNPPVGNLFTKITDLSGAKENITAGVLKDYEHTFNYSGTDTIFNGLSADTTYVEITEYTRSSFTVKAKSSDLDYKNPGGDSFIVHINCGHDETNKWTDEEGNEHSDTYFVDTSFDLDCVVNFYEKITREQGKDSLVINARDAVNHNIFIDNAHYFSTAPDYPGGIPQAHNAFRYYSTKKQDVGEFTINSDTKIPLSQYFTLDSDSNNIHKISEDYQSVPYKFRFFNSEVQTKLSDIGTYKKDLDFDLTICCAPSETSQFRYNFLDRDDNEIVWSNLPEIILMNQEDIMVSNLLYENNTDEGGYCRAFRCTFRDYYTKQEYHSFDLDSEGSYSGEWSGKIMHINDGNYNQLPSNVVMELVIEPYFYFNDSFHRAYSDVAIVIGSRFLKIEDYDLLPKLIFPILSKSTPWTPMMLPDVERFGYEFMDVIWQHWNQLKAVFGININGYDLFFDEAKYYTYTTVVKHIICNMGQFVMDKGYYLPDLQIKPFILTMYNTPQVKRIYANQNNSILDTRKETIWRRPIAICGDYLRYFDAERFMQFINKYKPLNNNEIWTVPTELRGYIIDTDFWIQKADYLNSKYVKSMFDWLNVSPVSNNNICWIVTKFQHKKGEYIIVRESPATHDYLYDMGFTHDYLHQFTHDQIAKMATINNLKQNYYDLLVWMSVYVQTT